MRSLFRLTLAALVIAASPHISLGPDSRVALVWGPSVVAAQGRACVARGAKLPAAGSWVEYRTAEGTMRLAYLAKETAGERIEMAMTGRRGPMVMQMVVPGYPYEMTDIKEMVMQQEGQPPMRMPEQMLAMMRGRMPNASQMTEASCARMTEVGSERITVPAGTFQTTHYRDSTGGTDVWVAANVPFGMVKAVSGERTVELMGSGTGATTRITGTPQDMPGMMGPPPGGRPRNQ